MTHPVKNLHNETIKESREQLEGTKRDAREKVNLKSRYSVESMKGTERKSQHKKHCS